MVIIKILLGGEKKRVIFSVLFSSEPARASFSADSITFLARWCVFVQVSQSIVHRKIKGCWVNLKP